MNYKNATVPQKLALLDCLNELYIKAVGEYEHYSMLMDKDYERQIYNQEHNDKFNAWVFILEKLNEIAE